MFCCYWHTLCAIDAAAAAASGVCDDDDDDDAGRDGSPHPDIFINTRHM